LAIVAENFVYTEPRETEQNVPRNEAQESAAVPTRPPAPRSANSFLIERFSFDSTQTNTSNRAVTRELHLRQFKSNLKAEIDKFSDKIQAFLAECELNKRNRNDVRKSNNDFRLENKAMMPFLFKTAIILLNIPSSSAFIERFFSICGVVCECRRESQSDNMIICRSKLKANIEILKRLSEQPDFSEN
jgi:hypothetical protein